MRNYSGAFQRTGEISREPRKSSDWLEDFAEKLAIEEQAKRGSEEQPEKEQVKTARALTAVEVARQRKNDQPSVFEMMSAIVSGKQPKYSSVEEAVKDYQQRTGLTQYLQSKAEKKEDLDAAAQQIVQAGDEGEEEEEMQGGHENELSKIPFWKLLILRRQLSANGEDFPALQEEINRRVELNQAKEEGGGEIRMIHQYRHGQEDEGDAKKEDEPKGEKEGEDPEKWLAKVVELFGNGGPDDDGPGPGGSGAHSTLFEVPEEEEEEEWEEAAADDECADCGPMEMFASAFKDLTEKKV